MCLRFALQETLLKNTPFYRSTCFVIIHLSFLRCKFDLYLRFSPGVLCSSMFFHVSGIVCPKMSSATYYILFPPCFICKLSLLHGSISKFKTQSFKFLQTTTDGFNMFWYILVVFNSSPRIFRTSTLIPTMVGGCFPGASSQACRLDSRPVGKNSGKLSKIPLRVQLRKQGHVKPIAEW